MAVAAVARMTPWDVGREGGLEVVCVGRPFATWFAGVEVVDDPCMMSGWTCGMVGEVVNSMFDVSATLVMMPGEVSW